jgi:translocation and assembly module TamA
MGSRHGKGRSGRLTAGADATTDEPAGITAFAFVLPERCARGGILAVMRKHLCAHGSQPRTRACPATRPTRLASLWVVLLVGALSPGAASGQAFVLEIAAPPAERALLAEHLTLPRYHAVTDLDEAELNQLLALTERESRTLLRTIGEFSPDITLERDTGAQPLRIVLRVKPGPITRVLAANLNFAGDIATSEDPSVQAQREGLLRNWSLPPGRRFTQASWDEAKASALRGLQARRYPRARQVDSRADIDPGTAQARLGLTLDSGPRMRLGPIQPSGLVRHTPLMVTRLARLREGDDYDAQALLNAQDRLVASGYFDAAFLHVEPEADPAAAPVQATLREAPLQKVVLGLGISTDQGPRATLEHRHLQLPGVGGRLDSRVDLQRRTPSLQSEWLGLPDARGWRRALLLRAERQRDGELRTNGLRLRAGQLITGEAIDRNAYLQLDQAQVKGPTLAATGDHRDGRAVTANYAWTTRRFDQLPDARRGFGLALELGLGITLLGPRQPFERTYLRGLWLHPLGNEDTATQVASSDAASAGAGAGPLSARAGQGGVEDPDREVGKDSAGPGRLGAFAGWRLQLRAEAGAVFAPAQARVPATVLFRTGGDTTVRGYSLREIGVRQDDGSVAAGHTLAVASVEWLRPLRSGGRSSLWEQAFFIDTGAVADRAAKLRLSTGVGTGLRYASPVGPLRADLAWAVQPRRLRLHLSVGVVF